MILTIEYRYRGVSTQPPSYRISVLRHALQRFVCVLYLLQCFVCLGSSFELPIAASTACIVWSWVLNRRYEGMSKGWDFNERILRHSGPVEGPSWAESMLRIYCAAGFRRTNFCVKEAVLFGKAFRSFVCSDTGIARTTGGSLSVAGGILALVALGLAPVTGGASTATLAAVGTGTFAAVAGAGATLTAAIIKDRHIRKAAAEVEGGFRETCG